jgi:hypothetical protein
MTFGQVTNKRQQAVPKRTTEPSKAERRLSLDQIRKLISIRTPDNVVAQEIQARGVIGDYGRREIDQLQQQGAGPQTITVLQRMLPLSSLRLKTEPGATVKLDNGAALQSDANGLVTFTGIERGEHQLAVEKMYYKASIQPIILKARENAAIEVPLDWAVGFLSVTTDVADAQITIGGNPPQLGRVNRLALPVGFSTVVVRAPLRQPSSQSVHVEGGKETTIAVSLSLDAAAISAATNQVHLAFQGHNYAGVLQQSVQLFRVGIRDKDVLGDVALSYLETRDYARFVGAAEQALSAGAQLSFRLTHIELGFKPNNHPAEVKLSNASLVFKPIGRCNHEEFSVPIREVRADQRRLSFQNLFIVNLVVPNPSKDRKGLNINMGTEDPEKAQAIKQLVLRLIG